MGAKRWQIEELETKLKAAEEKIKILLDTVDYYERYFENLDNGKKAKQAKNRIRTLEGEK